MRDTVTKSKNVSMSRERGDGITASPRPWQVRYGDTVADATGAKIAACWRPENAALIVDAVNEYSPIPKTEMLADAVSANIALVDERDRLRAVLCEIVRKLNAECYSNDDGVDPVDILDIARKALGEDKP